MAALREDVQSAYLDITEFTGQSLTGPRELITRRVLCSNVQQVMTTVQAETVDANAATAQFNFRTGGGNNPLQQLNFRILSNVLPPRGISYIYLTPAPPTLTSKGTTPFKRRATAQPTLGSPGLCRQNSQVR